MSKVNSFGYYIEYKDGSDETMDKNTLESLLDNEFDNFFNKINKIVKRYILDNDSKEKYCMTVFTTEHTILASEYINHYRTLSEEHENAYGTNFLSEFDIELISMFNE
jgi:hypothetical protein